MKSGKTEGFTLVEVLVSIAILLIVVLAVGTQYLAFKKSEQAAAIQLQARSTLARVSSKIASVPGEFPPIYNGSQFLSYVACFTEEGDEHENLAGRKGFAGQFLPGGHTEPARDPVDPKKTYCPSGEGGLEIHVTPEPISKVFEVIGVLLPDKGRNFKIPVEVWRVEVAYQSSY